MLTTNLDGTTLTVHTWSLDNLGNWLLSIIKLGYSDLLSGCYRSKSLFQCIPMGTRYAYHLITTTSFSICQILVLTKTFIPYEQFDLYIILKVTAVIFNLNLTHFFFLWTPFLTIWSRALWPFGPKLCIFWFGVIR